MNEDKKAKEFEAHANDDRTNIVQEFCGFLGNSKKWWLTPIILLILFIGFMVILGGTGVAPFIYTLF